MSAMYFSVGLWTVALFNSAYYFLNLGERVNFIPLTDFHPRKFGGVFQAIKKDTFVTQHPEFDADCEIIWTQCQIKTWKSRSVFFLSYYCPNTSDMISLDELNNCLFKLSDKINYHHVIVAGDCNASNIDWENYAPEKSLLYSDRLLELVGDSLCFNINQENCHQKSHIEQITQKLKSYKILRKCLPLTFKGYVSSIVNVEALLVNLQPRIIKN